MLMPVRNCPKSPGRYLHSKPNVSTLCELPYWTRNTLPLENHESGPQLKKEFSGGSFACIHAGLLLYVSQL